MILVEPVILDLTMTFVIVAIGENDEIVISADGKSVVHGSAGKRRLSVQTDFHKIEEIKDGVFIALSGQPDQQEWWKLLEEARRLDFTSTYKIGYISWNIVQIIQKIFKDNSSMQFLLVGYDKGNGKSLDPQIYEISAQTNGTYGTLPIKGVQEASIGQEEDYTIPLPADAEKLATFTQEAIRRVAERDKFYTVGEPFKTVILKKDTKPDIRFTHMMSSKDDNS